jgi:hypothetical protein
VLYALYIPNLMFKYEITMQLSMYFQILLTNTLSLGVKQPGHAIDHSLPSSAEVKNVWSYTFTPPYLFMVWYLVKHRDNFILPLPYVIFCLV